MTPSTWEDIPSSTELFGGDFFGDELMEMYSAPPSAAAAPTPPQDIKDEMDEDEHSHPGILVALNAAAMDGGLGALGSSSEFVPVEVPSSSSDVTGATATTVTVALQAATPMDVLSSLSAATGPLPDDVASAFGVLGQAVKKQKAEAGAVVTRSATAKIATSGGIKLGPAAHKRTFTRSMGRGSDSPSAAADRAAVPGAPGGRSAFVVPRSRMPVGGGINHRVLAGGLASSPLPAPGRATVPAVAAPAVPAAVVSAAGVKRAPAEEDDFREIASAAVASLVRDASPSSNGKPAADDEDKCPADTSTSRINALTSQNWVAACNPVPAPAEPSAADRAARTAKRATLSAEERAKQNRDRNREHARNTRLRKKAYVEELKRTLTELVAQRDAADVEKRHEEQREREQREVRFRVVEEFLKLRGRNVADPGRWTAILEDGFVFTLPGTPFRSSVAGSSTGRGEQVLRGPTEAMEDSGCLASYLQDVGGSSPPGSQRVHLSYRVDRDQFFMDGSTAFADFAAKTAGLVSNGVSQEVSFGGSVRASFSPASNKLVSVDLRFDTGAVVLQVSELGSGGGERERSHLPSDRPSHDAVADADELLEALRVPDFDAGEGGAEANLDPVSVSSDDGSTQ